MTSAGTRSSEVRDGVRTGAVSAVDVCRDALARIEAADPSLNAFNTVSAERALARAADIDRDRRGIRDAPLAGVPVALKDNICTRGVRTTASSRILEPSSRRTTPPSSSGCTPPAPSSSARRTATSSRWARPPRTRRSGRREIRGRSIAFPADRAAGRRSPWPPGMTPLVARLGHRRIDSPARRHVRHRRPQADVRPRVALRAARVRIVARSDRPVRAQRARRGDCARRHRGRRSARTRPARPSRSTTTRPR